MGKYSFPLCGNLQRHISSVIRPQPDDEDDDDVDDDDFLGEERVSFASQKEYWCNCTGRWTTLNFSGEFLPDVYYVWFLSRAINHGVTVPRESEVQKEGEKTLNFSWEGPKAQLHVSALKSSHAGWKRGVTQNKLWMSGLLSFFKSSSKILIYCPTQMFYTSHILAKIINSFDFWKQHEKLYDWKTCYWREIWDISLPCMRQWNSVIL